MLTDMIPGAERIGGTASVGSPNGAGGSGGGGCSEHPQQGSWGAKPPTKFFWLSESPRFA